MNRKCKEFLSRLSGVYWHTRYVLLHSYSHKRLSRSHGELIVAANMLVQTWLKSGVSHSAQFHDEMENLCKTLLKADETHKWHSFRPEA